MILIHLEVIYILEQSLQHLICGDYIIKAHQRNCVAYSGVVSVKRNDIGNAHILKLLKRYSTVKRLSVVSSVLSSAVKYRCDNVDTVSLTADSLYDTLEVLEVIVGRHTVHSAEQWIFKAVVAKIGNNINIITSYSVLDKSLTVTGRKSGAFILNEKIIIIVACFP